MSFHLYIFLYKNIYKSISAKKVFDNFCCYVANANQKNFVSNKKFVNLH